MHIKKTQILIYTGMDKTSLDTSGRYYEHSLSSLSAIYLTKWLRRSYVSIMSITKRY